MRTNDALYEGKRVYMLANMPEVHDTAKCWVYEKVVGKGRKTVLNKSFSWDGLGRLDAPGREQAPGRYEIRLLHLAERLLVDHIVVVRHTSPLAKEGQERPKSVSNILVVRLP